MDPALAVELKALSRLKAMNEVIERGDSPVQQFYRGATVFITGGSGFLGKQLIEKLYRACDMKKVYILLRSKNGMSVRERLQEMLTDPVYEMVRKKKPKFADSIVPVEGDVADIRLGLSDDDWNTITQEVDMIYHMAATTRFDESLRVATLINVRGTREALALGKDCKKLKSFVYVSTTYANATFNSGEEVLEKFYPCPMPPGVMIDMAESVNPDTVNAIEDKLLNGYPNTYTFAKAIAEEVVRTSAGDIPFCVVRPAVVISSYREPVPGWADMSCAYGASGLILGPASGLVHVSYASDDVRFSLVPVDYVNNAIIVAGWHTATRSDNNIKIYSVSSARNLFPWRPVSDQIKKVGEVLPTPHAMWYVFATNTGNKTLFLILTWLLHYIPGYILDGICMLLRKPPTFIKLYKRVFRASIALSYFTTHNWAFLDENTDKLYQSLTPEDKLIFNFDTTDINLIEYVSIWCVGLRKYLIKDGIKNTEYARKKQFWFHKLHCVASAGYFYVFYKVLCWFLYAVRSVFWSV